MKTQLPESSRKIASTLAKLKEALNECYQSNLQYVVLYGSYARGDFHSNSDIDILVVLNHIQSEMKELETLAELKTDIIIDDEIYISTNAVQTEKFLTSNFQYYQNVRNEGIEL